MQHNTLQGDAGEFFGHYYVCAAARVLQLREVEDIVSVITHTLFR